MMSTSYSTSRLAVAMPELLQEQLGQLNYTTAQPPAIMNHGTVQAIMYLQRDAHLPQTGQLNNATETR